MDFKTLASQFKQALQECRELFLSSARRCIEQHAAALRCSPEAMAEQMDELHRGLVIKIYFTIAEADRRWSIEERRLAQMLVRHVWQRSLNAKQLREAAKELSQKSQELSWYALIRPFDQIAPLRDRVGELESVVLRLATLIARADGEVTPVEAAHIKNLQQEIDRHLRPIPIDEPGQHQAADEAAPATAAAIESQARQVREQFQLGERSQPAAETKPATESQKQSLAEALAELDPLIGLENIKHEVHTLTNFLRLQQQRRQRGLPETSISLHMVFLGNPGTGKTTVARIVGRVFGAMGVLKSGHLVETDRSGLVAQYAGQTGPKANKKIDEALDGVLFIDEAYSLIAEEGQDGFGQEAVQTLLKRMEDDRQRLVVILAGYPAPIERLLRANPGLSSRFSRKLRFEDYTPQELCRIYHAMCEKNHYHLPPAAQAKLLAGLTWMYDHRDEHFGNGRLVRNLFETSIRRLANRVAEVELVTDQLLTVFESDDVHMPLAPESVWQ